MNDIQHIHREIAFGKECKQMEHIESTLNRLPHWESASAFKRIATKQGKILKDMSARLTSKPVVTVTGPTGCGKSTLINALTGDDTLVKRGENRPTTRDVTAIAQSMDDVQQLQDQFSHNEIRIETVPASPLHDVVLLDTPDTDSAECLQHQPLLHKALQLSDVLVCVFDVRNPKRQDNIKALAPWVHAFPGEQIYLVLNWCDRLNSEELEDNTDDFLAHISRAWTRPYDRVFRISARDALRNPDWPDSEKPRQNVNELDALQKQLQELRGGNFLIDLRLARARHINESLSTAIREDIQPNHEEHLALQHCLEQLDQDVADAVITETCDERSEDQGGMFVMLYGALAQRWWGPTGFFLGLWRRLVDFRSPLHALHSINPIKMVAALAKAVRAMRDHEAFEKELVQTLGNGLSQHEATTAKIKMAEKWPDLAERLIHAGFDPAVREPDEFINLNPIMQMTEQVWGKALKQATGEKADRLSRAPLQFLLNLPTIAGLTYVCTQIIVNFSKDIYLPGDFFLHSSAFILVMWLVPAFMLQFAIQRSRKAITTAAVEHARDLTRKSRSNPEQRIGSLRDELKLLLQLYDKGRE